MREAKEIQIEEIKNLFGIPSQSELEMITKQTLIERIRDKTSAIERPDKPYTIALWKDYLKDVDRFIEVINEYDYLTLLHIDAAFEGLNAVYRIRAEKKMKELHDSMDTKLGLDRSAAEADLSIDELRQSLDEYSCWLELSVFSICRICGTADSILKIQEKWGLCIGRDGKDTVEAFKSKYIEENLCTIYQAVCLELLLGEFNDFDPYLRPGRNCKEMD